MVESADVNCDKGRELGCQTYCCRLLVRLDPEERAESENGMAAPGFVAKTEDGYCVHFDRDSSLCAIWRNRPRVCREYSCNPDFLLQVALREEFSSMVDLVRKAQDYYLPKEQHLRVPCCEEPDDSNGSS